MIVIVNYGVGNLASVKNMMKKAGFEAVIASDEKSIEKADKIILPGIGAFDNCMKQFNSSGLRPLVTKRVVKDKVPFLGICVGMQMLTEKSEEGVEAGLGWIAGKTVKFKKEELGELKIPHMGWTSVRVSKTSKLTEGLGEHARFYFVHSFYVETTDHSDVLLTANYGYDFTAAINHENVFGVQFHPEKSHKYGMKIFEKFGNI